MNTEIYFVRHAHSVFSLENEETRELSEKGWQDAQRITEIMANEGIDHIVSSSYLRARQTVEGLAELMNVKIELDNRFRERDLAARDYRFEDPLEAMKKVFKDPHFRHPGGESNHEVQERGISALKDVVSNYQGKKVAIGIHGNIMTCTLSYFDEKFDFDFWEKTTKPDIYKLTIDPDFQLVGFERLWEPCETLL
ncbi:histidine phosphatase family protein [Falsibacillus pallidus]|uniref:histidine phosphatase family protein n=1 Tax=Falsibacillus pallidus TaxID=493781 RepID=UPI003D9702B7